MAAPTVALGEAAPHVRRGQADRAIDGGLYLLTAFASLVVIVTIGAIIYKVADGASLAFSTYGLGFLGHTTWNSNPISRSLPFGYFGAGAFVFGTLVTSALALLLAVPIGVAIGLFLSLFSPPRLGAIIGPLVELLAAIPSIVLGLWGLIFLAPIMASSIEPFLHNVLGWIPIFGEANPVGTGLFTASVILTIMVVPIIASITRELFRSVPPELKDGALALGATRWEMVRGVVLSSTVSGMAAASILGLSRAMGEAIAVTLVIGDSATLQHNLFLNGDTIGSRLANEVINTTSHLWQSSLFYLAAVLLVIELIANFGAQLIVRHYAISRGGTA